jgi:hypothetical protein
VNSTQLQTLLQQEGDIELSIPLLNTTASANDSATTLLTATQTYTLKTRLESLNDNQFLLHLPQEHQETLAPHLEAIPKNTALTLLLTRNDGLWTLKAPLKQLVTNTDTGLPNSLCFTTPKEATQLQRRKHLRVQHLFNAQLTVLSSASLANTAPLAIQGIDISAGGLRFKTPIALEPDTPIQLSFNLLPDNPTPFICEGSVVYCFVADTQQEKSTPVISRPKLALVGLGQSQKASPHFVVAVQFKPLPAIVEQQLLNDCLQLALQHQQDL